MIKTRIIKAADILEPLDDINGVARIVLERSERELDDDKVTHAYLGGRLDKAGVALDAVYEGADEQEEDPPMAAPAGGRGRRDMTRPVASRGRPGIALVVVLFLGAISATPAMADASYAKPCQAEAAEVQALAALHLMYPQVTELSIVRSELLAHGVTFGLPGNEVRDLGIIKLADVAFKRLAAHPEAGAAGVAQQYLGDCMAAGPLVLDK